MLLKDYYSDVSELYNALRSYDIEFDDVDFARNVFLTYGDFTPRYEKIDFAGKLFWAWHNLKFKHDDLVILETERNKYLLNEQLSNSAITPNTLKRDISQALDYSNSQSTQYRRSQNTLLQIINSNWVHLFKYKIDNVWSISDMFQAVYLGD